MQFAKEMLDIESSLFLSACLLVCKLSSTVFILMHILTRAQFKGERRDD